jgi:hypothetical protein
MNRAFAGGTPMEAKIVNPPSQPNEPEKDTSESSEATAPLTKETASDFPATSNEGPKTLEEALEKIRVFYKQEQAAKWGQGDQVNQVEDAHLALKKGYKEAREWAEKELPDLDIKTLYKHASVAKYFSEEHSARWGVSKLQTLITLHDLKDRSRSERVGDPADLEVQVPRADGSLVAKKFRDCSYRELASATRHRKQARKTAGRVIRKAPTEEDHASKLPSPVLWRPLAMIGLGAVAGFIGDLLHPSFAGVVVSVLALLLTLGGFAELVRYFVSVRDRIIAALKSGVGLRTLKEHGIELLRSGRKLRDALKSVEPKSTPTPSREEVPPPPDKKAA